ncbi:MAG: hypothetical protein CG446_854, partial [Methanosaeta sp. ASO1]
MPFKNLGRRLLFQRDNDMYSIIEIVGKDSMGWEYAVKNAIDEASENLRDL